MNAKETLKLLSKQWCTVNDIMKICNVGINKAGIKVIRTHDFRHSCASLLINNGANIMIVAKYLGHAKTDETLNTYSHLFQSKLDDAVKTINDVINKKNK